jgi:hypothetical protein
VADSYAQLRRTHIQWLLAWTSIYVSKKVEEEFAEVWNRDRSIILSLVATRTIGILALVLAAALPFLVRYGFFDGRANISADSVIPLLFIYYAFLIPALIALFALNRMLLDVRQNQVFTAANVSRLRRITWCCFAAGVILLVSSFFSVVFFALAILAAFFGLILRTMKNLFAAAVALQEESDYTI